MNVLKKYRKNDDYEKMAGIVDGMRNAMTLVAQGDYSLISQDEWNDYIDSLIEAQEGDGSWTVSLEPSALPPDEKVEFIQFPWALALSSLALHMSLFPNGQNGEAEQAFSKGASSFSLQGFGEDQIFQVCEILLMFIRGGLPRWLKSTGQAPELKEQLDRRAEDLQARVDSGNTQLPFGGDYKSIYTEILQGLTS